MAGSTLDISGVPGTGKTATVLGIIHELQEEATRKVAPPHCHLLLSAWSLWLRADEVFVNVARARAAEGARVPVH